MGNSKHTGRVILLGKGSFLQLGRQLPVTDKARKGQSGLTLEEVKMVNRNPIQC
jgi:hypothetical protein